MSLPLPVPTAFSAWFSHVTFTIQPGQRILNPESACLIRIPRTKCIQNISACIIDYCFCMKTAELLHFHHFSTHSPSTCRPKYVAACALGKVKVELNSRQRLIRACCKFNSAGKLPFSSLAGYITIFLKFCWLLIYIKSVLVVGNPELSIKHKTLLNKSNFSLCSVLALHAVLPP